MTLEHLRPHGAYLYLERVAVAGFPENCHALRLKLAAEVRVARDKTGARQRLMLPEPGAVAVHIALIARKHVEGRNGESVLAIGPQSQIDVEKLPGRCLHGERAHHPAHEAAV